MLSTTGSRVNPPHAPVPRGNPACRSVHCGDPHVGEVEGRLTLTRMISHIRDTETEETGTTRKLTRPCQFCGQTDTHTTKVQKIDSLSILYLFRSIIVVSLSLMQEKSSLDGSVQLTSRAVPRGNTRRPVTQHVLWNAQKEPSEVQEPRTKVTPDTACLS